MGTVRALNPKKDIEEFIDFLYGKEKGWVYVPTKAPNDDRFTQYHFKWPEHKDKIVEHIERHTGEREVYIAPALFSKASGENPDVLGTNVLWAEFDGKLPTLGKIGTIPQPTLRVRSSVAGHEHWYWKLDEFNTDLRFIQDTNRGLSYTLGADTSGWDGNQVLRPIGTVNHKHGGLAVTLLRNSEESYSATKFAIVPVPSIAFDASAFDRVQIPKPLDALLSTAWSPEERNLLLKVEIPAGSRSSALMRVAYTCCEKGLSNEQVYALVEWADTRWGKFSGRNDAEKRYVELVNKARVKFPVATGALTAAASANANMFEMVGVQSILAFEENIEWLIEGLLPVKGLMYVIGKSGVGKTMLCTQLILDLGLGLESLNGWQAADQRPRRVLFWSLEMNKVEIKDRLAHQCLVYSEEQMAILEENVLTYADYDPLHLYNASDVTKFENTVEAFKPDIVLIDSASVSFARSLSDEVEVKESIAALYRLRNEYNFTIIVVHHARKDPPGHSAKATAIDDVFGSKDIAGSASTIIGIRGDSSVKDINFLKTRFTANEEKHFSVTLNGKSLRFNRDAIGALPVAEIPKQRNGESDGNDFHRPSF